MFSRICRNLLVIAAWLVVLVAGAPGIGASVDTGGPRELLDEARRAYEARQVDRAETLLAASGQARALLGDAAEGIRRVQTAVDALRARGDVEALARASAILMSVMPPGPAKDSARDAAFAAARASSSRGHECAIRHAWGGELLRAPATARALRAAQLSTLAALRQGKVTVTTPGDLNGRGRTVALPDHPLFWAGFIVVGEP